VDDTTLLVLLVVAAVVVIGILLLVATKARRRKELRSRFGPEYDRTVAREGSARAAERDLRERAAERDQLHLRDLTAAERDRYRDRWQALQASFVDRPESSLADADHLISALMRDRGYPVDDFERQADLVSVDHPQVVAHYRAAHAIHRRVGQEHITTEDQRKAVIHYRALFEELIVPGDGSTDDRPGGDVIDISGDGQGARHAEPAHDPGLDRARAADLADDPSRRQP